MDKIRSALDLFPTEELILHKIDGSTRRIIALVDGNKIHSDDVEVDIEEDDILERSLPSGAKEYYKVLNRGFYKGTYDIPDNYQCQIEKIPGSIAEKTISMFLRKDKPHKVFISHASIDADYVEAFVELLEVLGLREDEIICSSIPPYCIPLDNKVYDWLIEEFQQSNLHVIYALSDDYYDSAASLNEMGATWALKHKYTGILMPGFTFDKIKGCIDQSQIHIKLDDKDKRTLNFRLDELKNNLIEEFGLRVMASSMWERKRDNFLEKITCIANERLKKSKDDRRNIQELQISNHMISKQYNTLDVSIESAFLLVYAATGNGQILKIGALGEPTQVSASGRQFMENNSQRESARWQEALETLVSKGWAKSVGLQGEVFELTGSGYKKADYLMDRLNINTKIEPFEEIRRFEKIIG